MNSNTPIYRANMIIGENPTVHVVDFRVVPAEGQLIEFGYNEPEEGEETPRLLIVEGVVHDLNQGGEVTVLASDYDPNAEAEELILNISAAVTAEEEPTP